MPIKLLPQGTTPPATAPSTTTPRQPTTPPTGHLKKALDQTQKNIARQHQLLLETTDRYIFAAWPEYPDPTITTKPLTYPPLYPTTSINESAVTALYGSSGLKVDSKLLNYIKVFYFYLEYCAKRERAAKILTLADEQKVDYNSILSSGTWSDLITAITPKGSTAAPAPINYGKIVPTQDAWDGLTPALQATFTSEKKDLNQFFAQITTTSFWSDLALTNDELQDSLFWQDYIKIMITNSYTLDNSLLNGRVVNEQQLFTYLPYLETAYYLPDYTEQRYTAELTQLALVFNEHCRNRFLPQSTDWGSLKTPKKTYDYEKILARIECFQQSNFFQILQNMSLPSCKPDGKPEQDIGAFMPCDPSCDPSCDKKHPRSPSCADIPFVLQPDGTYKFKQVALPAPFKHEIIFLSMAVTLQSLLYELFQKDRLEKTLETLATVKNKPPLSILPYELEDGVFLQDWEALSSTIPAVAEQNAQSGTASKQFLTVKTPPAGTPPSSSTSDNETVMPQGFLDWVEGFGKSVAHEVEQAGEEAWATTKDVGDIVANEAKVIYYQSGLANIIQNMPPEQSQQLAGAAQSALNGDFTSFQHDVTGLVTNVIKITNAPSEAIFGSVLAGIGAILNDPSLAKDYDKMLNYVADAIGTAVGATVTIAARLDTSAIVVLSSAIIAVSAGPGNWSNTWADLANDIVSSILESVSIAYNAVKTVIADVVKSVGYLIKLITDSIIDVGAAVTAVFDAVVEGENIATAYAAAEQSLATHRNFISQLVTVGLLVGATVAVAAATGGFGIGFAISLGGTLSFGGLMCMSGWQQDENIGDIEAQITEYLNAFTTWANNQVPVVQALANFALEEAQAQSNSLIINAQLGLGFAEDFYSSSVNRYKAQAAYQLGTYQASVLAPDPTWAASAFAKAMADKTAGQTKDHHPILTGDVGATYGFSTGWLSINPGQGLALYEPSRQHFAQEIAQMPATFTTTDPTTNAAVTMPIFWFLQSVTKDLHQPPAHQVVFDIRVRPLYLLDKFYVGIGIGGTPLDEPAIKTKHQANIDSFRLAKIIVFKKESSSAPVSIGVYEHETQIPSAQNGWLSTVMGPEFNPGVWYRMKGTLNGAQLQIQVWQEGKPQTSPTTVTVTPLPTTKPAEGGKKQLPIKAVPLSVIFSGASVEFDVIEPSQKKEIHPYCSGNACTYPSPQNTNYQSNLGPAQSEIQREQNAILTHNQIITPSTASLMSGSHFKDLAPVSLFEIVKGHYIYKTSLTTINKDTNGALTKDYVVFAVAPVAATPPITLSSIGVAVTDTTTPPNALVSLLTGNVFNLGTGNVIGSVAGVWKTYRSTNESIESYISSEVEDVISKAIKTYFSSFKEYTFGSLTLTPVSTSDFEEGNYVYTTTIAGFTDYVILANIQDGTVYQYNLLPPQIPANQAGMISLVTYSGYEASSCTTTSCKPFKCFTTPTCKTASSPASGPFTDVVCSLSTNLASLIKTAQAKAVSCQKQQAPPPVQQSQPTPGNKKPGSSSVGVHKGSKTQSTTVPNVGSGPASNSSSQQENAANQWGS